MYSRAGTAQWPQLHWLQKVPLLLFLHIFIRNELSIEEGKRGVLFLFCLEICLAQIHKGTSCAQWPWPGPELMPDSPKAQLG